MRRLLSFVLALALLKVVAIPEGVRADDAPVGVASLAEPSISPDGSEIAFVSSGDIWSVASAGGTARLLVAADGYASRPLFSPDGARLAFVSSRPGAPGIYVVTLGGGRLTRLTHDDAFASNFAYVADKRGTPTLSAWSADSRSVYFSTATHNIGYFQDVMRVNADGGTPMRVVTERYVNSADAFPSPDGRAIAYTRNGYVQWWRRGHSHMDQSSIVVLRTNTKLYETITAGDAKDRWPMWSPHGATIYFVSDRSGRDEIWSSTQGRLRKLTSIGGGSVLWPTIARDGRTVAFEHDFGVWRCDTASGATRQVPIALRGLPDVALPQHLTLTSGFSDLDLAPDGKKIAFVARGRAFVASATEGGKAQAVPLSKPAAQAVPMWAPGSQRIAFTVDGGTETAIATYDFPDGPERTITPPGHFDDYPHWSPDGKSLAFVRDGRELRLLDVATLSERVLATAALDRRPFGDLGDIAFSPAGDWIAFVSDFHARGFANVSVVPVGGGELRKIADLPDGSAGPLVWSPDGTRLYFVTSQRTENGQIAQIDLIPRAPRFREDEFRHLFDQPRTPGEPITAPELPSRLPPSPASSGAPAASPSAPPTPAPRPHRTTINFDGIFSRLTLLQTGLDGTAMRVAPNGKTLVLIANAADEQNLYSFNIDETSDEPAVARQITSTPGQKTDLAIAPDGRSAIYLDGGGVSTVPLGAGGAPRPLAVSASLDVDFNAEKDLIFRQAWSLLDRWYADPAFHGTDWKGALRIFEPHALGTRTPVELRRVVSLMLGGLNSSHLGIGEPPIGEPRYTTGRLGVEFNNDTYEHTGRLRIAEITPLGPVALNGKVAIGDDILAINGRTLDRHVDIDDALSNTIAVRTILRVAPRGDTGSARDVVVLPVDLSEDDSLRYQAWVASRRAYVERVSGGRLGYVHLLNMSANSLERFYRDLDVRNRAKDGVVVDVRNNRGGFVSSYALDVLTRREYITFKSRFGSDATVRSTVGQRALDKPTVLVTNEHSLSDAESFTEGYRVLHAGSVVGTPTAGWEIWTSTVRALADGSSIRLPSTRVFAHDGVDMELHPRPVDVYVDNPVGAAERGDDPQLDAGVRELLRRIHR
jgi:tricorn protease